MGGKSKSEEEEIPPVKVGLEEISRDGKIKLSFNQKMVVPPFDDLQQDKKRDLLSMSEMNVNRDIIEFKFKLFSD